MAQINPDDPFNFGQDLVNFAESGGIETGDDVELGNANLANENDSTYISVWAAGRAALVGHNLGAKNTVGVYGYSEGSPGGIGVAGMSPDGVGVYGIVPDQKSTSHGIGVVGRAMNGIAAETDPIEVIVPQPVGVFGHSHYGPGVRGHSGPTGIAPQHGVEPAEVTVAPGGVFSSGRLQSGLPRGISGQVSADPSPQLRLTPSIAHVLPTNALLGDLFMHVNADGYASLYLCTWIDEETGPLWQRLMVGENLAGGSVLP
jgi:hypothetical protein